MSTQGRKRTAAAIAVDGRRNKAAKRKQITVQTEEHVRGAKAAHIPGATERSSEGGHAQVPRHY